MSVFESNRADERTWDVVVVGGGAAGLTAALTLARVRRSVLVIDAGEPRNAPAAAADGHGVHGLLGREGISPLALLRIGREEVASYGGRVVEGRVTRIERSGAGADADFVVDLAADGPRVRARRILLATGLVDELPPVPGLAERWGRDVVHCVYCQGWEVRDRAIGVLGTFQQALMFRGLSAEVTLFRQDGPDLTDEQWEQLAGLGVAVVDGEVAGLAVDERDRLAGVRLASGAEIPIEILAVAPHFAARTDLFSGLGLPVRELPRGLGRQLAVDASGATGVTGVWAAGNAADAMAGVAAAAASGMAAAAAINLDLLNAEAEAAAASRATTSVPFSAALEAETARRVQSSSAHGLSSLLTDPPTG
ncbi:NAD(P)/FAD-dependent oxidoreductase [Phaeacidiphilus oryzae]|uniref:NAD(P)/FAD-dependent oxidoreductase n=1 Tax=Phaeacidiphilus oryzae TaxID=348818 RepID=UPI0005693FE0|nr:NAD(P)/FAD-dependent oxidoreductase [Phaeacidiphilus oryzae]